MGRPRLRQVTDMGAHQTTIGVGASFHEAIWNDKHTNSTVLEEDSIFCMQILNKRQIWPHSKLLANIVVISP